MRFSERPPSPAQFRRLGREHRDILQRSARIATHKASLIGRDRTKAAMKAAGLGRLPNAVGHTSSLKERHKLGDVSVGLIYARGGDESLAGGALEVYSRGGTIRPVKGEWLWFQTKAMARTLKIGDVRTRLTPARYNASGKPLGPLKFRRINSRVAHLYVESGSGFNVSVKTGRAKPAGPRKTRTAVRKKRVVVFIGIRYTSRAKRFDKDAEFAFANGLIPDYMMEEIAALQAKRGLA